jgi:hypothetical protein
MKALCIFGSIAFFAVLAAEAGIDVTLFNKVKAVSDGICSVTNVAVLKRGAAKAADPLAMWAAIQEDEEAAHKKGMFVRVDFVLKPELGSDILCRAELPPPEVWDGRM